MPRRRLEKNSIRKISKVGGGNSFSVTLPIALVRELGWREKQKVVIKKKGQTLVIEDWKES